MRRGRGQWNAYVAQGRTKEIRRARLAEVPAEVRDEVKSHVRTWFAVRGNRNGEKQ